MNSRIFKTLFVLAILSLGIAACSSAKQAAESQATPIPAVKTSSEVTAEGNVVPNESVKLSFLSSGKVSEVLVKKGDVVKKGDLLAALENREQIEASIAQSELSLLTAQQALDDLNKNLETARASLLQQISQNQTTLREAQFNLDNYKVSAEQAKMDAITAADAMKKILDEARKAYEPYRYDATSNDPQVTNNSQRSKTRRDLKDKLDTAQSNYNVAVKRLEYEFQVKTAQANLDKSKQDLTDMKDGPDPEKVASVNAQIKAAEAALASAKANLDNLEIRATIDGAIVDMDLIVGQQVSPAQTVIELADLSELFIETDNLTEIDVVKIAAGQKVTVVADALPDVEMTGVVDRIADVYEEKRGDITYTAKIKLDNIDPRLRWGMTVLVTFKK